MRVNGEADVLGQRAHLDGQRRLGDDVGRAVADDVDAEHLVRVGVDDDLHEAVGVGVGDRAAERGEGELADLDLAALRLGLLGADAGGGDFGVGEDHGRDAAHVHLRLVAGDDLGDDLGLLVALCASIGWPVTSPMA